MSQSSSSEHTADQVLVALALDGDCWPTMDAPKTKRVSQEPEQGIYMALAFAFHIAIRLSLLYKAFEPTLQRVLDDGQVSPEMQSLAKEMHELNEIVSHQQAQPDYREFAEKLEAKLVSLHEEVCEDYARVVKDLAGQ